MIHIDREHEEYKARKQLWKQYRDLYAGGEQFRSQASDYLVRRQKEPGDVYLERLNRVFYENYAGSIVDWYGATLFRREPVITAEGNSEQGRRFLADFIEDCDRKSTGLTDFLRRQFLDALVCGAAYTLVDFPRTHVVASSRAAEEEMGATRAYLVSYSPEDVINWSRDEHGNLDWVVLRTTHLRSGDVTADPVKETRWIHYDRERFSMYRREEKTGTEKGTIELLDSGRHGFAALHRVPLFETRLPEGLWLMNKAGLLQLEHFNKSNALAWALTMGLFATPVIYSDREWNQIVGESYYIQLGPEDRFGWTEPQGNVYHIASENLTRLKEEIYRVCYLLSQAGSAPGSGNPVSGFSKQRDFAITQEVLRAYGDVMKDTLKRILRSIEHVRQDGLLVSVSGLDEFDIGDFSNAVQDAAQLLALGIGSPTLKKQVFKKLAFQYLSDERQEVKDNIAREIEVNFPGGNG